MTMIMLLHLAYFVILLFISFFFAALSCSENEKKKMTLTYAFVRSRITTHFHSFLFLRTRSVFLPSSYLTDSLLHFLPHIYLSCFIVERKNKTKQNPGARDRKDGANVSVITIFILYVVFPFEWLENVISQNRLIAILSPDSRSELVMITNCSELPVLPHADCIPISETNRTRASAK